VSEASELRSRSALEEISTAMVRLHKEQFGRGPTRSRAHFAGPDALLCVLNEALLPAERKMVALGQQDRVSETRMAFQTAARSEFVAAVEQITGRKVIAFASAVDPDADVVFENFSFEARAPADNDGSSRLVPAPAPLRAPE
jgi:uncharacterized protein YbcI